VYFSWCEIFSTSIEAAKMYIKQIQFSDLCEMSSIESVKKNSVHISFSVVGISESCELQEPTLQASTAVSPTSTSLPTARCSRQSRWLFFLPAAFQSVWVAG
jgi:hypothetical protein